MNEAGRLMVQYLVNSVWQTPLLLTAAWLVSRIFRKLGCAVQHRVWVAGLIVASIAPFSALRQNAVGIHLTLDGGSLNALAGPNPMAGAPGFLAGTVRLRPAVYQTILFVYLIFLMLAALRLGWALYVTWRLARQSTPVLAPPPAAEIWERCRSAFATPRTTLAYCREIRGPVTIGLRSAHLLLPPGFLSESPLEDIAAAMGHECGHLERRDFLLNLLYEFLALPITYHPATLILKSRIAETRELVCDRMGAERITGSVAYARSLLRLAAAMNAPGEAANFHHAIGMFDANTLENRIMNLMTPQLSVSQEKKVILVTSGIFLFSVCGLAAVTLTANVEERANVAPQQAAIPLAQPAADAPIQSSPDGAAPASPKTYRIGNGVSAPKLLYAPDPEYPRGQTKQGVVVVALIVDATGQPQQVQVARSLAPAFDTSATRAVEQYRFKPALLQGKPVAVQVHIEVNFRRN